MSDFILLNCGGFTICGFLLREKQAGEEDSCLLNLFLERTGLCCLGKLVWIAWSTIQMNLLCHPFSLNLRRLFLNVIVSVA